MNFIEFLREKKVPVKTGQTILEASLASGIPHYHSCGGQAKCSTCRVLIIEGSENLSGRNSKEKTLVERMNLPDSVRLACQTKYKGGDVKLHRIIRDQSDVGLYKGQSNENIGEEKQLVLMFLDIKNFTPFSANFLPFDVIHILRKMFFLFQINIDMHGGKIIDTAGDGLYAVFGLNSDIKDAAFSALAASESIIHDTESFNKDYLHPHFHHVLDVGIGLHTGKVIVGNLTVENEEHMTVMGYAVNVASRIQSATRKMNNNFLVSEEFAKLLPLFRYQSKGRLLRAKGVEEKIRIYTLGRPFNEN